VRKRCGERNWEREVRERKGVGKREEFGKGKRVEGESSWDGRRIGEREEMRA
jgi:hypothetical protein